MKRCCASVLAINVKPFDARWFPSENEKLQKCLSNQGFLSVSANSCEFVDSLNIDELLNNNYCDIIVFAQQILIPLIYIFSKMTTLP